ncbi:MAG: hypothetical protein ABI874_02415 [Chloroflexota bacterium]
MSGAKVPMVIDTSRVPARHTPNELAPINTEQALAIGGAATVAAGTLVWLAARWLAPRVAGAVANRLPQALAKPKPLALRELDTREVLVESFVWIRRITFRR